MKKLISLFLFVFSATLHAETYTCAVRGLAIADHSLSIEILNDTSARLQLTPEVMKVKNPARIQRDDQLGMIFIAVTFILDGQEMPSVMILNPGHLTLEFPNSPSGGGVSAPCTRSP